jgi:hypothetical protein
MNRWSISNDDLKWIKTSFCLRSVGCHERQSEKGINSAIRETTTKGGKSMAIKGSEKKMSRRVCWSTVRRAVHYRSFQLGSNCSHDFNLNRDDDGRISWLILLPILKEEGKRAKVVRNTQVVVVYLWRYDDDWFPLIWFDFIFLFINSQTRYAGKLGKLLVIE